MDNLEVKALIVKKVEKSDNWNYRHNMWWLKCRRKIVYNKMRNNMQFKVVRKILKFMKVVFLDLSSSRKILQIATVMDIRRDQGKETIAALKEKSTGKLGSGR